jgi:uncharacterized protein
MAYFALIYDVVESFGDRRTPYRPVHLEQVREAHARGEIVIAGALGDPPSGALLVFRADSPDIARAFAEADPYVRNGLVTNWRVVPWNVVVGADA